MRFDGYDDALRAHSSWLETIRSRPDMLAGRIREAESGGHHPLVVAVAHSVEDTVSAPTVWITDEMFELVLEAAEDFDPSEPVTTDDIFIPHGFLVMPRPHVVPLHGAPQDIPEARRFTNYRCLLWRYVDALGVWQDEETFVYNLNADGVRTEPGVRFTMVAYGGDQEQPDPYHWSAWPTVQWGIEHATAAPLSMMQTRDAHEKEIYGHWLKMWRVLQRIMSQRIIVSSRYTPMRAARREAQRVGLEDPSTVQVIELRRPRSRPQEHEELGSQREWSHRWIVGAHWRNQWYPSEGRHKQILIPAYVKGPDDKPLIHKRRVFNFDR